MPDGMVKPDDQVAAQRTPRSRTLLAVGLVAAVGACFVVVHGLNDRARASEQLARTTDAAAIPTVAVVTAAADHAVQEVTLPGTINAFYNAPIYARVPGYLKDWYDDIGARVKKGQVLAIIDTPDLDRELDQAKADLVSAQAQAKLAQLTAQRWKTLLSSQAVSEQTVDEKLGDAAAKQAEVLAAQAKVDRLDALESFKQIVAPFDGVVTARTTDIGDLITPGGASGKALFQVSALDKVRIYVQVPQAYSEMLRPGITATMAMPQYPGRSFTAKLVTTSASVTQSSLTELVELQAPNPDGVLVPGNFTEVTFKLPPKPHVLSLPSTALVFSTDGMQVATLSDDGKVVFKRVQVGNDLGTHVEILAGLSATDRVINSPPETLVSGEAVRLADDGDGHGAALAENTTQHPLN
jgi:RND family efflux transporter MFP subunit